MASSKIQSTEQPTTSMVTPDEQSIDQTHNMATPTIPYTNLLPSGWKAVIPIPLIKTSGKPILIIRVDPMQAMMLELSPPAKATRNDLSKIFFSPLQQPNFTPSVLNRDIKIMYEAVPCEHYHKQLSHRIMRGTVDMVLRISANTSMTGSFMITEHQDVERDYRNSTAFVTTDGVLKYVGYTSVNQPLIASTTYGSNNATNDLSLTRHFEFRTQASCAQKYRDTYMAWDMISTAEAATALRNSNILKENVVTFTPLTDITAPETSQITVTLFWDFSKVEYLSPLLPVWPYMNIKTMAEYANLPYQDITAYYNLPKPSGKSKNSKLTVSIKDLNGNDIKTLMEMFEDVTARWTEKACSMEGKR